MYTLVQFSKMYETGGPFNTGAGGGTADYAASLLFATVGILLTYPLVESLLGLPPFFALNMIYFVLYVWSKRNPTANANIWGIPVAGMYLPFAYLALRVLMGAPYMDMLHGMAIGHVYYFVVEVVPSVQGKDIFHTPTFMIDYFGVGEYRPDPTNARPVQPQGGAAAGGAGFTARPPPNTQQPQGGGGHNWGTGGRALGRS